jgi:hypothetical protein
MQDGQRASNVVWIVDDTRVGSIGPDGVFRANGLVGGLVVVTAKIGTVSIKTQLTVDFVLQENSAASPADAQKLVAGGSSDASFQWLYPYDRTVFPLALQPPVLQFGGTCADLTYLKLTAPNFLYEQFAAGTVPTRLTIPDTVWKGITVGAAATGSLVTAEVSKLCAGQATGPATESWIIANGKMKGVVYYTAYQSTELTDPTTGTQLTGAVRLVLGSKAEGFIGGCTVCHSVSANGEVLASGREWSGTPSQSWTFDLTTGAKPPPAIIQGGDGPMFSFPALTPDGKRAFTSSGGAQGGVLGDVVLRGMGKAGVNRFVDTTTAQPIPFTVPTDIIHAQTPTFSPDGKYLAFNRSDVNTHTLAIMDYDGSQNPAVFSNPRNVATSNSYVTAWPSFLPDSTGCAYHEGEKFDTTKPAEVRLAQFNIGTNAVLALNGYNPDSSAYTDAQMKNFEPTVMPRPIGGYFWVMFTSGRSYGNTPAPGKKVWVSAVDIDHAVKTDPSHPAFFLPGQVLADWSVHPFVSLEPCKPLGASCESGVDCCDGFCRETGREADGTPILQCVPPPVGSCSNLDEACITVADCCDQTQLCIIGRCSLPTPIIR